MDFNQLMEYGCSDLYPIREDNESDLSLLNSNKQLMSSIADGTR